MRVTPARKGPRVPSMELLKQLMVSGEFVVAQRWPLRRYWLATARACRAILGIRRTLTQGPTITR